MAKRQYPWVRMPVPWSDDEEFTRGTTRDGEILLSWGIAPFDKLATRRQLRAKGLRPGGHPPVALLYFRCRAACKKVFAELFLIDRAKPVRPMTPARRAALDKALAARRTCAECGEQAWVELPRAHRTCEACRVAIDALDPTSWVHDYLIGIPIDPRHDGRTLDPAPVVPLLPHDTTTTAVSVGWFDVEGVAA